MFLQLWLFLPPRCTTSRVHLYPFRGGGDPPTQNAGELGFGHANSVKSWQQRAHACARDANKNMAHLRCHQGVHRGVPEARLQDPAPRFFLPPTNISQECQEGQASIQRTPWGGGKKRGEENLTNDTPPKKGFWTPPSYGTFSPPSGVVALFFLYKNPRLSRPEAVLEGSRIFREGAFSGTFSSPHTFCTPPCHCPKHDQNQGQVLNK